MEICSRRDAFKATPPCAKSEVVRTVRESANTTSASLVTDVGPTSSAELAFSGEELSPAEQAAIGIGTSAGVVVLLVALGLSILHIRRRKRAMIINPRRVQDCVLDQRCGKKKAVELSPQHCMADLASRSEPVEMSECFAVRTILSGFVSRDCICRKSCGALHSEFKKSDRGVLLLVHR